MMLAFALYLISGLALVVIIIELIKKTGRIE